MYHLSKGNIPADLLCVCVVLGMELKAYCKCSTTELHLQPLEYLQ